MDEKSKSPRLLFIEDNADTRKIYKDVFEREGFHVLAAEDGEKGLSYAQATLPDVILLDLMLPKISGSDLLKRLRAAEETRHIPVMVFSARDAAGDLEQPVGSGMIEYSAKAVNSPKQMVHRIRALMARVQASSVVATPPSSVRLFVTPSKEDASRVESMVGLKSGFLCSVCGAEAVLEMLADPTRSPGHWFVSRFLCSMCQRVF